MDTTRITLTARKVKGLIFDLDYNEFLHKELIVYEDKVKYTHIKGIKDLQIRHIKEYEQLSEIILEDCKPKYIRLSLGALVYLKKLYSSIYDIKFVNNSLNNFLPLDYEKDFKVIPEMEALPTFLDENGKPRQHFYDISRICFKHPLGIIKAPTGSGKSMISINLSWNFSNLIGRGLIVVPTKVIMSDYEYKFKSFNIPYETLETLSKKSISDLDNLESLNKIILVCPKTFNSSKVYSLIENQILLESISWIIYDECQWVHTQSYIQFTEICPNLRKVLGFSATPFSKLDSYKPLPFSKLDRNDAYVKSILGGVIYSLDYEETKQFLNPIIMINYYYEWNESDKFEINKTSNWATIAKLFSNNQSRNQMLALVLSKLVENSDRRIICHNSYKIVSETIQKLLSPIDSVTWFGGDKVKDSKGLKISRFSLINKLKNKKVQIVLGTNHLVEGLNLEGCQLNGIVLSDGKLERVALQKVGRVMRKSEKTSIILNFIDSGPRILYYQGINRSKAIQQEYPEIQIYDTRSLEDLNNILIKLNTKN